MAVAYQRSISGTVSAGSTTAAVNLSACSIGELAFVEISRAAVVAPSGVPSDWTLLDSHLSTYGVWLYYKVLASGDIGIVTWTWAASAKTLTYASVFSGSHPTSPIATYSKGTYLTAAGRTLTLGSVTTDEPAIAVFAASYSTTVRTHNNAWSGFTERVDYGHADPDFQQWHVTTTSWGGGAFTPSTTTTYIGTTGAQTATYRGGFIVAIASTDKSGSGAVAATASVAGTGAYTAPEGGSSTFGNTSTGAYIEQTYPNSAEVSKFTLSESGDVSKLTFRLTNDTAQAWNFKGVIYSDDGGYPDARQGVTGATSCAVGADQDVDAEFAEAVYLPAGIYWLGMVVQSWNGFKWRYDWPYTDEQATFASTYDDPPATADSPTLGNKRWCVYATYTPTAAEYEAMGGVISNASLDSTGTYTPPDKTGLGGVAADASLAGTGAYTPPDKTGSGGVAAEASLASFGEYTPPVRTGSGGIAADASVAGTGTYTGPSFEYEATGGVVSDASLAGSGEYTPPTKSGSGSAVADASLDATGAYTPPAKTGSGAVEADASLAGTGAYTPPLKSGSGAVSADASLAGVGTYTAPGAPHTGSGGVAAVSSVTGAGTYTPPVKTATGGVSADATVGGAGTYTPPVRTGSGAVSSTAGVAGTGTYTPPAKIGIGGVQASASLAGVGIYRGPHTPNLDLVATLLPNSWRTRVVREGWSAEAKAASWHAVTAAEDWTGEIAPEGWRATVRKD